MNWGASWGASWSEPSKRNVILGFRAPTTIGGKTSIMTYSANTHNQATITKNILLWEGVWS